jgi:hypothetical protein
MAGRWTGSRFDNYIQNSSEKPCEIKNQLENKTELKVLSLLVKFSKFSRLVFLSNSNSKKEASFVEKS